MFEGQSKNYEKHYFQKNDDWQRIDKDTRVVSDEPISVAVNSHEILVCVSGLIVEAAKKIAEISCKMRVLIHLRLDNGALVA